LQRRAVRLQGDPVRAKVDGRKYDAAELSRRPFKKTLRDVRVAAERAVFPVIFQGAERQVADWPYTQARTEFVRQKIGVAYFLCHRFILLKPMLTTWYTGARNASQRK
jgi:hypothetical protein